MPDGGGVTLRRVAAGTRTEAWRKHDVYRSRVTLRTSSKFSVATLKTATYDLLIMPSTSIKPDLLSRFVADNTLLLEAMNAQRLVQGNAAVALELISGLQLQAVEAGKAIIEQGGADNDIYFILAGKFDVIVNGHKIAQRGPGEQVGEMAATVSFLKRSATVRAAEEGVVGIVSAPCFSQIASKTPTLWKEVAKVLAERLLQRNSLVAGANAHSRAFVMSSVEALPVARAVQENFLHDKVQITVWPDGVFRASEYAVESLIQQLDSSDFGVAIVQPDDLVKTRGKAKMVPRDNVLFELGMFIGRLGRHRTFLMEPLLEKVKLPSDLSGITTIPYRPGCDLELLAGVAPACNQLRRCFSELGPK